LQSNAPFLRIGTRGSALALRQAEMVRGLLAKAHGVAEDDIAVTTITTSGDRLTGPLTEEGGKGLFTKEIEEALLAGDIDLGVHSSKDLATVLPSGLTLAAFLEREDVRDAFVSLTAKSIDELPQGATLGSSSIRRAAQMLRVRPDLRVVPFRGNVDTRLRKLREGVADATLLAVAGLKRLGRESEITQYLDPCRFLPAPAQGAIAVEARTDDTRTREIVAALDHAPTQAAVRAERAMLKEIDGSCRTPIGVYSELEAGVLVLNGELLSPDGREAVAAAASGDPSDPETIGTILGQRLLEIAGPDIVARFGP
jgi:hydroxymethylbilane synthase